MLMGLLLLLPSRLLLRPLPVLLLLHLLCPQEGGLTQQLGAAGH
jgi:hypothetical protein